MNGKPLTTQGNHYHLPNFNSATEMVTKKEGILLSHPVKCQLNFLSFNMCEYMNVNMCIMCKYVGICMYVFMKNVCVSYIIDTCECIKKQKTKIYIYFF